jgi:hypothetical protein
VDPGIQKGGDEIAQEISLPPHHLVLEKPPPEYLFPRTGDKKKKEKNDYFMGSFAQRIDPADLTLGPG